MGTFTDAPAVEAVMDAAVGIGIYDERAPQGLVTIPGVIWSVGPAVPAPLVPSLREAVRVALNNVGLYDEKGYELQAAMGGPVPLGGVVTVPDVTGTLLAAARTALAAAGCRVGTITIVNSAEPVTEVITQSVAPGANGVYVPVNLEVSEGPHAVPNLVDVLEATGLTMLTAADLIAGTRTEDTHATIVAGNIISTNPAAATPLAGGSAVDYVVSTGPA